MTLSGDYHVHSTYSDGRPLPFMLEAAESAGLAAVGITDHCTVSSDPRARQRRRELGFNLDVTYERRRDALSSLEERFDLTIYDAVELDYDARDESEIADFLDAAGFDYAIGSVHELDGTVIFDQRHFASKSDAVLESVVDDYYDRVVELIESELFDVVGHVDAIDRTPALRGYSTTDHYELVADALASSRTVPELNAGAIADYGEFHPGPPFLEVCLNRGLAFVPGSDAHRPGELTECVPALEERFEEKGVDVTDPFDC